MMKSLQARCMAALSGLLLTGFMTSAEIRLPEIIGSNMVLQRNRECLIWGWADRGERILVEFNGVKKVTRAGQQGKWMVTLPAMEAGGPYDMFIEGENLIELENILIGDVWICSGQSNMEWSVERFPWAEEESEKAGFSGIRLFTVPRNARLQPADDIPSGDWQECNPGTVLPFSAVGYFFGRRIHRELSVPVGLISTNWGGTNIETWTSREAIRRVEGFEGESESLAFPDTLKADVHPNKHPAMLFNGMVHPLLNTRIKGVIWYQGEANVARAWQYRELFPLMIRDWRKNWEDPEMPFLFVQLANYRDPQEEPGESSWAELREAQTMALDLPATGMAVAIDLGESDNIHPRKKQEVGERLAIAAQKVAYGKKVVHSGPVFREMRIEGARAILNFDHTGSGLVARDRYGYLRGFAIAGPDRVFYWAKASIRNNEVVVCSEKVKNPVTVRYGWADNPDDVNLYNMEGLPASPFRTDSWPLSTKQETR